MKIADLWFLKVKLKPEYNADNLEIYRTESILMEGDGIKILMQKKTADKPKEAKHG
ncbi:MAG: hypothetical protein PHP98_05325 [Kiritimatiellae bacterium]|nr:hypothetical protein [Kiritimatiellia bacterium]